MIRVKRTNVSFGTLPAPPAMTCIKLTETGSGLVLEIPADEIEELVLSKPKTLGIQEEGYVSHKKVMVSFNQWDNKAVPLRGSVPQSVLSFIAKFASPGISVRSDHVTLNIGKILSREELTWIYHLIAKTINGN